MHTPGARFDFYLCGDRARLESGLSSLPGRTEGETIHLERARALVVLGPVSTPIEVGVAQARTLFEELLQLAVREGLSVRLGSTKGPEADLPWLMSSFERATQELAIAMPAPKTNELKAGYFALVALLFFFWIDGLLGLYHRYSLRDMPYAGPLEGFWRLVAAWGGGGGIILRVLVSRATGGGEAARSAWNRLLAMGVITVFALFAAVCLLGLAVGGFFAWLGSGGRW